MARDVSGAVNAKGQPLCGAACAGGGSSSWSGRHNVDIGLAFCCNRPVKAAGDRCYLHRTADAA